MAEVRPFRASYYAPGSPYDQVLSPPYDVISAAQQQALYARDPHNFVRIDYAQPHAEDTTTDNVYTRAAETLKAWRAADVFATAPAPAYYLHVQDFEHGGQTLQRRDLFVLTAAHPFSAGQVLPHEKTLDGPKADRFKLMEHTQAHLSPIFALYEDAQQELAAILNATQRMPSLFSYRDSDGIAHSVYAIADSALVARITDFMQNRPLFIADGHHRYETAVAFRERYAESTPAAGYLCMYLSALEDEGLLVLPYHRRIRPAFAWPADLHTRLHRYFQVEPVAIPEIDAVLAATTADQTRLVMQTREGAWSLTCPKGLPTGLAEHRGAAYRELDVSVLHELLLYELAQFPASHAKDPDYMQFSPDRAVLQTGLENEGGVAFYVNATPVSALCAVAASGETMPPKSTYFYPKVPSGLLFTCFDSAL
ncbi:MAG: DUF1015 domain-containing protein [Candidatus Sericytochromatia bacterium]